jgi:photosystem II stability/assembly factor-like uncharacterized protein
MRYFFLMVVLLSPDNTWWAVQESGVDSNLRGVSVVSASANGEVTIWASGSKGAVVRSTDSGKTWRGLRIPEAESLDFRGVQVFDANTAYVMSSGDGPQSRIYKTTDGGQSWKLQYKGEQKSFFLDALVCEDEKHCIALSDPVDEKFVLLANLDGERWTELSREHLPAALPKEGAFAASNSSLCLSGKDIYFGTGGPAARVFASHDFGETWNVVRTPLISGTVSSGIFSLSCDGDRILAVGGDYRDPGRAYMNAGASMDGGRTWQLATQPPGGYRSSIGRMGGGYVAVGPTGSEISSDGLHWSHVGSENLNAYSYSSVSGESWAAGPNGKVARFVSHVKILL